MESRHGGCRLGFGGIGFRGFPIDPLNRMEIHRHGRRNICFVSFPISGWGPVEAERRRQQSVPLVGVLEGYSVLFTDKGALEVRLLEDGLCNGEGMCHLSRWWSTVALCVAVSEASSMAYSKAVWWSPSIWLSLFTEFVIFSPFSLCRHEFMDFNSPLRLCWWLCGHQNHRLAF